jgi:hypothetical protein
MGLIYVVCMLVEKDSLIPKAVESVLELISYSVY